MQRETRPRKGGLSLADVAKMAAGVLNKESTRAKPLKWAPYEKGWCLRYVNFDEGYEWDAIAALARAVKQHGIKRFMRFRDRNDANTQFAESVQGGVAVQAAEQYDPFIDRRVRRITVMGYR